MSPQRLGHALTFALFASRDDAGKIDPARAGEAFTRALRKMQKRVHGPKAAVAFPDDPRCRVAVDETASSSGMTVDQLRAPVKTKDRARAKGQAIAKMRALVPPVSYPDCARAVGLTNHTSAIEAHRQWARRHAARLAATPSTPSPQQGPAGASGVSPPPAPAPLAPADRLSGEAEP